MVVDDNWRDTVPTKKRQGREKEAIRSTYLMVADQIVLCRLFESMI